MYLHWVGIPGDGTVNLVFPWPSSLVLILQRVLGRAGMGSKMASDHSAVRWKKLYSLLSRSRYSFICSTRAWGGIEILVLHFLI